VQLSQVASTLADIRQYTYRSSLKLVIWPPFQPHRKRLGINDFAAWNGCVQKERKSACYLYWASYSDVIGITDQGQVLKHRNSRRISTLNTEKPG
jgi:hypothetical protein